MRGRPVQVATGACECRLSDVAPRDPRGSRHDQAREVFERMEAKLGESGLTFRDVIRTWFHLDDILGWYDEFNAVRNRFFAERGILGGVMPASTAVGITPPGGAALVGSALAVRSSAPGVRIVAVGSPRQCSAHEYGSAFSRAVEVCAAGQRHLHISGTASLDAEGRSVCPDDVSGQIALTMSVVESILASRGMNWSNVTRGLAYFRDLRDRARWEEYCRSHGLPAMSVEAVEATICRSELLFECELEAVCQRQGRARSS